MSYNYIYADKAQIDSLLPSLFDLFYDNMSKIAPSGKTRDDEFSEWFSEVSPAMQKAPRQIVLMLDGDKIIGYFQYYTRDTLLMMEEIQLRSEYHGSGLFGEFFSWLVRQLPRSLQVVEAYANKPNIKSQEILNHLGLSRVESDVDSLFRYRGEYSTLANKYL